MPTMYPVTTIAKLFGISERRVQQLAQDKVIPKAVRGQYDLIACVRAYIKYLQERAFGKSAAPQDTHLERARLLKAQADMAEIDLAERTGSLVTVDRVEADWMDMVSACRAKMLSIPTKTAYQIAHLENPQEIEKFLKRIINEALVEMASYETTNDDEELSSDLEEGDADLDATTGADGEPVGRSVSEIKPGSE